MHIFLSPHLDDAALSCGGIIYQLAQAGHRVQVITLFAGDPPPAPLAPFAQSLHDRWQADPAARRMEDVAALRVLGAEPIHWPYPDAVYRRDAKAGKALYDSEESIFDEVQAADAEMIRSIAQRLSSLDPAAHILTPLSAGHHVDHQIVRAAAETSRASLIFYEDYPYAETPAKLEAALDGSRWTPERVALSDAAIRAKAAAILAYRSQMSTFFESAVEMEARVRAYACWVGGGAGPAERLWRAGPQG
jgi:LmbE family N-acetylglucosaminyl deacetylase